MNLDLTGKNAIVCGSTQGIGKAIAMELASLGANITLAARDEKKLAATQAELPVKEGQVHGYVVVDFTFPPKVKTTIERVVAYKREIHILVNNTGGPPAGAIIDANPEEFRSAFSNHLVCNHILVQACVEGMKESGYGRIINIISTSVKQPLKGLGVSNTIRAAVANWSKTLSLELAPFGITVNNVLPGATNTVRIKQILDNKSAKTGNTIEHLKKEMISEIPMARFAEASEIANAVAFLASPAAAYITGINVPVDGGRTGCL